MIEYDDLIKERLRFDQWLIQHPAITIFGLCMLVFFTLFVIIITDPLALLCSVTI